MFGFHPCPSFLTRAPAFTSMFCLHDTVYFALYGVVECSSKCKLTACEIGVGDWIFAWIAKFEPKVGGIFGSRVGYFGLGVS